MLVAICRAAARRRPPQSGGATSSASGASVSGARGERPRRAVTTDHRVRCVQRARPRRSDARGSSRRSCCSSLSVGAANLEAAARIWRQRGRAGICTPRSRGTLGPALVFAPTREVSVVRDDRLEFLRIDLLSVVARLRASLSPLRKDPRTSLRIVEIAVQIVDLVAKRDRRVRFSRTAEHDANLHTATLPDGTRHGRVG